MLCCQHSHHMGMFAGLRVGVQFGMHVWAGVFGVCMCQWLFVLGWMPYVLLAWSADVSLCDTGVGH